jgi:transcriptional regulator with XRE-family HTH domain
MKPENSQFAPFLSQRRAELGLSIKQLADRVGIAKSTLHQWESGTSLPGAGRLSKLSDALEMSYEDFVSAAGFGSPVGLPAFTPYMRAKYGLKGKALKEAEEFFRDLESRQGGKRGNRS